MDLTSIWVVMALMALFLLANRILRYWLVTRAMKQSYDKQMRDLVHDPEARPKGRFE
jgi:hypothetical protein